MDFTITVPDELAVYLHERADQLPRILEIGMRELDAAAQVGFTDASEIFEFLATLPSPQQIVALQPSATLQERVRFLLTKNQTEGLTSAEEREWQRYEYLEHLVRMAKATAFQKLKVA